MNPLKKMKLTGLRKKIEKHNALRESGNPAPRDLEIKALFDLAKFYDAHHNDNDFPFAAELALEAYRAAAKHADPEAQYICGQRFLEKGKFWHQQLTDILPDDRQRHYAKENYAEAFQYLQEAQKHKHPLALRLHGMAYVNGWGVELDTNVGFKMVIDSIDWANAWDNATKIFEELGLNSPDFFQALGAMRGKS